MSASLPAPRSIVIVGASLAGASAADALRRQGYDGELILVGAEREPPYERPPLSKGFLAGRTGEEELYLRSAAWYAEQGIELLLGRRAARLDARERAVVLEDGQRLAYEGLVIATGCRARPLDVPGAELPGVHYLRTGFQDRRSFSSAPYSADDVAFNQNTDVGDWCLARSIYQGCALNQKILGIRVRQSQQENRNRRQTHR